MFGDGRQVYYTRSGGTHYATRLNEDGTVQNWTWKGHGSGKDGWRLADLFGNGRQMYYTRSGGTHYVTQFSQGVPNVVNVITDSAKQKTTFEYDYLTNPEVHTKGVATQYPLQERPPAQAVVTRMTQADGLGIGGTHARTYTYEGKRRHMQGLGDLGFEVMTETDEATNIVTRTRYSQDWQNRNTHRPVEITQSLNGITLLHTLNSYRTIHPIVPNRDSCGDFFPSKGSNKDKSVNGSCSGGKSWKESGIYFTYSDLSTVIKKDLTDTLTSVQSTERVYALEGMSSSTNFDYREQGRTVCVGESAPSLTQDAKGYDQAIACSALNGKIHQTVHANHYYPASYSSINHASLVVNRLPLLQRQSVTAELLGSSLLHGNLPYQSSSETRTTEYEYDTSSGLLTKEVQEPDDSTLALTTTYQYNNRGQLTQEQTSGTGTLTKGTSYAYQPNAPYSLASKINGKNQTEEYQYSDARFPWLATKIVAINGLETDITYDSLGRKASQRQRNHQQTWTYAWCAACDEIDNAVSKITQTSNLTGEVTTYYDALERPVAIIQQGQYDENDIKTIRQRSYYNALGQEIKTTLPYFTGDATGSTAHHKLRTFDQLGRTVTETFADGSLRTQTFNGRSTTVTLTTTDGTQQKTSVKNALGQQIQTIDNDGNQLQFQYSPFGQLVRTLDPSGNQVQIGYNLRGHKTRLNDPDQGEWTYSYYADGQLKSQTDAKGQTTTNSYDQLGRLVSKTDADGTSTYIYDNCGLTSSSSGTAKDSIGQLCSKTRGGFTEHYSYTQNGLLQTKTTQIDSDTYVTQNHYDQYGRLTGVTYPTGYQIEQDYHPTLGFLEKVRHQDQTLWHGKAFNAKGQLEAYSMDEDNLTTTRLYQVEKPQVDQINVYQKVAGSTSGSSLGTPLYTIDYDWSGNGNLKQKKDLSTGVTINYQYDSLNRLTNYTTSIMGATHSTEEVQYDALGNITYKSDLKNDATGATGDYSYGDVHSHCGALNGGNAFAGPHAVTHIDGKGNYCYDANGQMTSGNGRTLQYAAFSKPTRIQKGSHNTQIEYGADYARYKRVDTNSAITALNKTTHYIGNYEKTIKNGQIHHKIQLGDFAIIEKIDNQSEKIHYTLRDDLGTLIATVEANTENKTGKVKRLHFDPWGKRLELPILDTQPTDLLSLNNFVTDRGFTGHEHLDAVQLIHMNGRVYDPSIARFVSADPFIQAPSYLQSYNRYSYVWNNPLNATDPSGYYSLSDFEDDLRDAGRSFEDHVRNAGRSFEKSAKRLGNRAYKQIKHFGKTENLLQLGAAYLDSIGCAGYCSASLAAHQAYIAGASSGDILISGLFGYTGYKLNAHFSGTRIRASNIIQRATNRGFFNGAYASFKGGDFYEGFKTGFKAQFTNDLMQFYIESSNKNGVRNAEPTMLPGSKGRDAGKKGAGAHVRNGKYNNIGIAWSGKHLPSIGHEGSMLMTGVNFVPGMNYMSVFHDTWAGSWRMGAVATAVSIIPAMQLTYNVIYRNENKAQRYLQSL
ncbi:hypothetical protein CBF23_009475 [Marinomonas agarivorans]|nr:hypothetical protein CBF23_009475 [Marinomonas agarivorans]